jgi:hypothetical protein
MQTVPESSWKLFERVKCWHDVRAEVVVGAEVVVVGA